MAVKLGSRHEDLTKDMEALIDLFLSPDFEPIIEKSSQPNLQKFTFESDMGDEDEDEECDGHYHKLPPFVHDKYYYTKIARTLAKCGDEFYRSYSPPSDRRMGAPWSGVSEKLKQVFLSYTKKTAKTKDPQQAKQEEERAYDTFKDIMSNSIKDTGISDGYQQLGAFLLTIHGLSELQEGVRGLARGFYSRYIRERELDSAVQHMGGLDGLMERELD